MAVERAPAGTSLIDVLDRVLDKGIVIDAYVRVSLVGIDLVSVEARIVVASVETYLKYAEAIGITGFASRPGGIGAIGSGTTAPSVTSSENDRLRAENVELKRRLEELS
jgi:gas vesicle structural protein